MTQLNVNLPDSIYNGIRGLAQRENISLDHLVALALSEKMSAMMTEKYLRERSARGDRKKFLAVLDQAPDVPAEAEDRY